MKTKLMKPLPLKTVPVTKMDINHFFKALHKAGFFARQSYWCCNTCGCAALEKDLKPKHRGWVFYNRQDASAFRSRRYDWKIILLDDLYLTFGDTKGNMNVTKRIGREVEVIALRCGLLVDWNGDPQTRIRIHHEKVDL